MDDADLIDGASLSKNIETEVSELLRENFHILIRMFTVNVQ
jgi:hypothetical protein